MLCANPIVYPVADTAEPFFQTPRDAQVCAHGSPRYLAQLCGPDAPERAELEQFVREVFKRAYGACIRHFMPQLMSLRDTEGQLLAVCGLRNAGDATLFLETYLDKPVEQALSERVRVHVGRRAIVEVGNLAVAEPGVAPHLLASVSAYLHSTHASWAVFTAIPVLRNSLARLNMAMEVLADATLQHIQPEERDSWGSYYDKRPQVMAVRRVSRPNGKGVTA